MFLLFYLLPIAAQVLLIVHVFRTGKDRFWIYLLIFLPVAGGIAYLLLEVLPPLLRGRGARTLQTNVSRLVDPSKKLRDLEARLSFSSTVANKMALAEAYAEAGDFVRASELYESCLEGVYKQDRKILLNLARTLSQAGQHQRAVDLYRSLSGETQEPLPSADRIAYAAALEGLGDLEGAGLRYAAAAKDSPGLEARYHYAAFLNRIGRTAELHQEMEGIFRFFEQLPRYAQRAERRWIEKAKRELIKS